jgi:hypothetical protein
MEEDVPSQWPPKIKWTSNLNYSKKDKKGHFILIKGAIHQEEITVINLYAPNVSAPNFIKHTLKDLNQIQTRTQ